MKHLLSATLLFAAFYLPAQQSEPKALAPNFHSCRGSFTKILFRGENTTETIKSLLISSLPSLADERSSLQFNYRHESLSGFHYSFNQTFQGIPVYQSEIKVNTDKDHTVLSIFDNSFDSREWSLNVRSGDNHSVIYVDPGTGEPVLASLNKSNPEKEIVEILGVPVYERDTRMYFAAPDSTVSGKVFNPDPLTTANQLYDTNTVYKNNNNANASWIEAQLQTVNFKADFDGIKFKLDGPYAIISDFDTPNVAPVVSTLPQFYYSRPQTGLEDVMAFYHASKMHDYVTGFGYDCANKKINMDPHAAYGTDQSYFSPNYIPSRIYFGTGGVPDAQDADVIIHEYSHFLSENASPNSNIGYERTSLDEGFGDYMAASYSRSLNTFNQDWVFNWDGHNEFWAGRIVNADKYYPQHLTHNGIYRDGEIWSSTLFRLNKALHRSLMDSLILEVHYNYGQNISMKDAAQLLIIADTLLTGGANYCVIYQELYVRGLMPFRANPCGISSINETGIESTAYRFTQDGQSFTLFSTTYNTKPVGLDIYSTDGRRLVSISADVNPTLTYQNSLIPSGIYLVYIQGSTGSGSFKWVKTN